MGNAVGSLSEVQHAIVIGSLLGDGSMRCKANALLEINHSSQQRGYVDWKFSRLADLVTTPPKERSGNGGRVAYRFVTRSEPALTPYYRLILFGRAQASAAAGASSFGIGRLVHGRWLSLEKRGVPTRSSSTRRVNGSSSTCFRSEFRYKLPRVTP